MQQDQSYFKTTIPDDVRADAARLCRLARELEIHRGLVPFTVPCRLVGVSLYSPAADLARYALWSIPCIEYNDDSWTEAAEKLEAGWCCELTVPNRTWDHYKKAVDLCNLQATAYTHDFKVPCAVLGVDVNDLFGAAELARRAFWIAQEDQSRSGHKSTIAAWAAARDQLRDNLGDEKLWMERNEWFAYRKAIRELRAKQVKD